MQWVGGIWRRLEVEKSGSSPGTVWVRLQQCPQNSTLFSDLSIFMGEYIFMPAVEVEQVQDVPYYYRSIGCRAMVTVLLPHNVLELVDSISILGV